MFAALAGLLYGLTTFCWALQHGASPGREFEAVLFDVLHGRADLVLPASARILVVATAVYGVNQQAPAALYPSNALRPGGAARLHAAGGVDTAAG